MNNFSEGYNIENRRYTGSKAKLSEWILELIKKECSGEVFLDIFAGTGIISAKASNYFRKLIINDFLYSNFIVYNAFFGMENWAKEKLKKIVEKYNKLNPKEINENYFSLNFGGKYFSYNNAKIIGYIRENIEQIKNQLSEKEYAILIASLVYSVDKLANTVGHYDAYRKKIPKENNFEFRLIKPIKTDAIIFRKDSNELAKEITADVVYIDPPYNSRQYSRFYHLLETLTKWDKPKLYGTALKPFPENMSDYCRVKASKVFSDLIKDLKCKFIVVSYNNTYDSKSNSSKNKITLGEIENILRKKGKTKIFKKNHKYFNSGKTSFDNHQEFIFITKVDKK